MSATRGSREPPAAESVRLRSDRTPTPAKPPTGGPATFLPVGAAHLDPAGFLLQLQRAAGNRVSVEIQRRFLAKPGDDVEAVEIKHPAVLDALTDAKKDDVIALLGRTTEDQLTMLKKLSEGADVTYKGADDLARAISNRLIRFPTLATPKSPARKLNRLAGQLEEKLRLLRAHKPASGKADIPAGLVDRLDGIMTATMANQPAATILGLCSDALSDLLPKVKVTGPQGQWLCYNAVSTFGPIGHFLVPAGSTGATAKAIHEQNLVKLRELRHLMAAREETTIVAHRGTGPTNRTMGGLIHDEDQRRKKRLAENSPEAFEAALTETTKPSGTAAPPTPALDGIECDVYMSKDGVPMLTHEGKVQEQLSDARKRLTAGVNIHTETYDLTSTALTAIQRTDSPTSRFTTLQELVEQIQPFARQYFEATGHPLRVEIEMKGTKFDGKKITSATSTRTVAPLLPAVAKILSRFMKSNPGLPVDFVLFNGTRSDVIEFSQIRTTKTALGGLYTAEGGAPDKWKPGGDLGVPDPAHIDELRYQFTAEVARDEIDAALLDPTALPQATKYLNNFMVTLVYGEEFAPTDHPDYGALKLEEPSHGLLRGTHTDAVPTRTTRAYDDKIQLLLVKFIEAGGDTDHLHILTDYPKKAKYLKKVFADAKSRAASSTSPAPSIAAIVPTGGTGLPPPTPRSTPSWGPGSVPTSVSGRPSASTPGPVPTSVSGRPSASTPGPVPTSVSGRPSATASRPAVATGRTRGPLPAPRTLAGTVTNTTGAGAAFAATRDGDVYIPPNLARGLRRDQTVTLTVVAASKGLKATSVSVR